jgi:hypothetical protein
VAGKVADVVVGIGPAFAQGFDFAVRSSDGRSKRAPLRRKSQRQEQKRTLLQDFEAEFFYYWVGQDFAGDFFYLFFGFWFCAAF